MKEKMKSLIGFGSEFAGGMGERRLTIYATSGCYYMFMSLVPIVMILCCVLPYTPFNLELILHYIDLYFAESLGEILKRIANAVYSSNSATLTISIFLTLFSASASMKAIMRGIDSAYRFKNKDNILIFTLKALLYMVVLVATILLSLVIMVYGGKILVLLQKYLSNIGILRPLLSRGRYLLIMIVLALVFLVLYKFIPSGPVSLKAQLPGAIFSAVTWVLFSWIFTIYIGVSDKFGAYGFIGTIMVAMMWMYYCLFFLLIGAYMNSFLGDRTDANGKRMTLGYAVDSERDDAGGGDDFDIDSDDTDENLKKDRSCKTASDASDDLEEDKAEGSDDPVDSSDDADKDLEDDEESMDDDQTASKKPPMPLIALAVACAVFAFGAVFFFLSGKKSDKKSDKKNKEADLTQKSKKKGKASKKRKG